MNTVSRESTNVLSIIKDIIVILLSGVAIWVSIGTCSKQKDSNKIALQANKLATEANKLAEKVYESSSKFDIINAETQWGILKDAFDEIDYKILMWENGKKLIRDGKSVATIAALEKHLEMLKVPNEIKRLYEIRHQKYEILVNVSNQYEPFKDRLAHVDFVLPAAPVLPQPTIQGVSIN
ncbi:hypothetical protein N9934_01235 [Desulfosarcina sp.]|nr:hypothetical protein [Desulfosarcina sp.]